MSAPEERTMQRIVVGVDGSEGGRRALRWAIAEARRRAASLHVVHAWHTSCAAASPFVAMSERDLTRLEDAEQCVLDHCVGGEDASGVAVVRQLVCGDAVHALLAAAQDADLLVVGSRRRAGLAGFLRGSVGQAVVWHAPCPVVVVPATRRAVA
jgi:nucleotide-binding universal stress UspA family protein